MMFGILKLCLFLLAGVLLFFRKDVFASSITLSEPNTDAIYDVNQEYRVKVDINIKAADNTVYFLRGVFFRYGKSDYCGYTYNGKDWFKGPYTSSEGWKNFLPVIISSSSASVILSSRIDSEDSGCQENGIYQFKIQRFTESGSGQFDPQNEQSLNVSISLPTPTIKISQIKPSPTQKPSITIKQASLNPTVTRSVQITKLITIPENNKKDIITEFPVNKISDNTSESSLTAMLALSGQTNTEEIIQATASYDNPSRTSTRRKMTEIIVLLITGSILIFTGAIKLAIDIRKQTSS